MKRKIEIEAALERSLRNQVNVPRLDGRFDAKVWERIGAEESRRAVTSASTPGAVLRAGRWLNIINVVGLAGVAIFASFFGAQMLAGVDLQVSLPEISAAAGGKFMDEMSLAIAGAAILVGFWFTPWGRRVRAELS
jgi:hypothetical protein